MLIDVYCVPDVKDPRKHVYNVYYSILHVRRFWRGEKRRNLQLMPLQACVLNVHNVNKPANLPKCLPQSLAFLPPPL